MKQNIHSPTPHSLTLSHGYSPDVVRFRFRKAFPELVRCFAWLMIGTTKGIDWHDLPDTYLKEIGKRRSVALVRELHDAQDLGLKTDHDVDNLICEMLGLSRTFLSAETLTSREFLMELYDHLIVRAGLF